MVAGCKVPTLDTDRHDNTCSVICILIAGDTEMVAGCRVPTLDTDRHDNTCSVLYILIAGDR